MSTTQMQPSGPVRICTGRNHGSVEARNSRSSSPFARWPAKRTAARRQHLPMHEQVHRLAGEEIALILAAQKIVPIDADAARRRRPPWRAGQREQLQVFGRREDAIRVRLLGHVFQDGGRGHVRISAEVMIGERIVPGESSSCRSRTSCPSRRAPGPAGSAPWPARSRRCRA